MIWGKMIEDGSVVPCSAVECNRLYFDAGVSDPNAKIVNYSEVGGVRVSTVFLGLNHGSTESPLWFETMVFAACFDDVYSERYATRAEAVAGHRRIFKRARGGEWA